MDRNPELIAKVRDNPGLYMSPGRAPNARDLAVEVFNDAIYLGCHDVTFALRGNWSILGAGDDWVSMDSRWRAEESFFHIEFIHQYRPNSNRANVLLGAFAEDLVVYLAGSEAIVLGSGEGLAEVRTFVSDNSRLERVVAFRLRSAA